MSVRSIAASASAASRLVRAGGRRCRVPSLPRRSPTSGRGPPSGRGSSPAAIDHVKVGRVHTRVPVATPERVTRETARALRAPGKASYVVLHVNHPRELTPAVRAACARLIDAGIPMLSQSVLLRGVNDDAATLGALMRALVESRIKPYYLHQGDLAPGTAHLRASIGEGQDLMRALRGRTSGLCQPTYVLDIPGGFGKVPIGPSYLSATGRGDAPYR